MWLVFKATEDSCLYKENSECFWFNLKQSPFHSQGFSKESILKGAAFTADVCMLFSSLLVASGQIDFWNNTKTCKTSLTEVKVGKVYILGARIWLSNYVHFWGVVGGTIVCFQPKFCLRPATCCLRLELASRAERNTSKSSVIYNKLCNQTTN